MLAPKGERFLMGIEGHIDNIALDAPAYILSHSLAIAGNKHPGAHGNKSGINCNHAMTHQRAAGGGGLVARIKGTVGRSLHIDATSTSVHRRTDLSLLLPCCHFGMKMVRFM